MTDSPLWDQAEAIRQAIQDEYATLAITVPERSYTAPGRVTADCPQLVVALDRGLIDTLRPVTGVQPPRGQCISILHPTWRATVHRCIPHAGSEGGEPHPPADDLGAASAELLRDIWIMHVAITSAISSGGDAGPCAKWQIAGFGLGPQSDLGSAFIDVSTPLNPVG